MNVLRTISNTPVGRKVQHKHQSAEQSETQHSANKFEQKQKIKHLPIYALKIRNLFSAYNKQHPITIYCFHINFNSKMPKGFHVFEARKRKICVHSRPNEICHSNGLRIADLRTRTTKRGSRFSSVTHRVKSFVFIFVSSKYQLNF